MRIIHFLFVADDIPDKLSILKPPIMKSLFATCQILFVLLLQTSATVSQNFDFSKYKPRTLSELIELNPGPAKSSTEKKLEYITADWFYSQVRVKYVGTSRPISPVGREVLKNWQKAFAIPAETVNLFDKEFLFRECDKEFWLPVQQKVSTYFPKELNEGEMITIYTFLAGGLRTSGKLELLFLVNEFEK